LLNERKAVVGHGVDKNISAICHVNTKALASLRQNDPKQSGENPNFGQHDESVLGALRMGRNE
jgi:hypothetical protein